MCTLVSPGEATRQARWTGMQAEPALLVLTIRRPWHVIIDQTRLLSRPCGGHTESVLYDVSKMSRENTTRFSSSDRIKALLPTRDALQVYRLFAGEHSNVNLWRGWRPPNVSDQVVYRKELVRVREEVPWDTAEQVTARRVGYPRGECE